MFSWVHPCVIYVLSVVILVFCDRWYWCMCEYLTSVCAVFEIHASLRMVTILQANCNMLGRYVGGRQLWF